MIVKKLPCILNDTCRKVCSYNTSSCLIIKESLPNIYDYILLWKTDETNQEKTKSLQPSHIVANIGYVHFFVMAHYICKEFNVGTISKKLSRLILKFQSQINDIEKYLAKKNRANRNVGH